MNKWLFSSISALRVLIQKFERRGFVSKTKIDVTERAIAKNKYVALTP
jgi:hypothetical protein